MRINIADWVQGNSRKGELIYGFVESVDPEHGVVYVNVVASDNEDAVGELVRMNANWVKTLEDAAGGNEAQLRTLIDVALQAGDESWFRELTGKLAALKERADARTADPAGGTYPVNRLGQYGLR